jgi:alpha-L-rhamnosidase
MRSSRGTLKIAQIETAGRRSGLLVLLSVALLSPCGAAAQGADAWPWQRIQMPTAAQVSAVWKNPPPEYGPQPYFDMSGAVDQAEVERDLDEMKALGFRAVTVQAGVNLPFDYLSEDYFRYFRMLVAEAKKRNMRVWIVDDIGYPSGFAGGKFTREKPELRMQTLAVAERFAVAGGETLHHAVSDAAVAVTAIGDDHSTIAIPASNGLIDWAAPAGRWQVLVVEHRFETSPTRSETNLKPATEPRPNTNNVQAKDRSQSLEDYLNPEATKQFLTFTHEQYKQHLGQEFGRTILGFRGDEPDYSVSGLPWTQSFFSRFQQVKGYDIRPYLATFLLPRGTEMTKEQARAKADYWDVFSILFAESFFKVQADWCAANHLEYQVHLNHEEAELELTHSEGEFFRDMRSVQVPGIDTTRHQIWTDTISDFPRLASSVAHVYGKPRAFTESFASYAPPADAVMARYVLNEQFVRGVNMAELMYFPSSNCGGRPRTTLMTDPGLPALMRYVGRLSYMMSMGRPTASVALYLPSSSLWLNDRAADTEFVSAERLLSEHQIDFDIVSEDALAKDLVAGRGEFETMSGNRYRTVIVPGASLLSQSVLERLHRFAADGGHVLFLGRTPSLIADKTILNARAADAAEFSWATVVPGELPPTPVPSDVPPALPPAPQVVPPAMLQAILAAIPERGVTLDRSDTAWRVMRRRWKDADVYLFFNEGPAESNHTVTLIGSGRRIEVWDPQTGEITPMSALKSPDGLKVTMTLQSYETRVLVTR